MISCLKGFKLRLWDFSRGTGLTSEGLTFLEKERVSEIQIFILWTSLEFVSVWKKQAKAVPTWIDDKKNVSCLVLQYLLERKVSCGRIVYQKECWSDLIRHPQITQQKKILATKEKPFDMNKKSLSWWKQAGSHCQTCFQTLVDPTRLAFLATRQHVTIT